MIRDYYFVEILFFKNNGESFFFKYVGGGGKFTTLLKSEFICIIGTRMFEEVTSRFKRLKPR